MTERWLFDYWCTGATHNWSTLRFATPYTTPYHTTSNEDEDVSSCLVSSYENSGFAPLWLVCWVSEWALANYLLYLLYIISWNKPGSHTTYIPAIILLVYLFICTQFPDSFPGRVFWHLIRISKLSQFWICFVSNNKWHLWLWRCVRRTLYGECTPYCMRELGQLGQLASKLSSQTGDQKSVSQKKEKKALTILVP